MSNNILLLDTNVILRYLLKDDDKLWEKAYSIFLQAAKENLKPIVLPVVFLEACYVLKTFYNIKISELARLLEPLLQSDLLVIKERDIIQQALTISAEKSVSLVDAYLVAHARAENCVIASFDKKLQKLS